MRITTTSILTLCMLCPAGARAAGDDGAQAVQDAVSNDEQGLFDAAAQTDRAERALRAAYEETVPQAVLAMKKLATKYTAIQKRLASAQTDNTGKAIAQDPILFRIVLGLQRRPILDPTQLASKQAEVRQLGAGLHVIEERGERATVGVTPTLDAVMASRSILEWAEGKRARIADLNRLFDTADTAAKTLQGDIDELPTLETAIEAALQEQAVRRAALVADGEVDAIEDANATIRQDAYEVALAAELQWSEQRRQELEALLQQQQAAFNERLLEMQAQAAKQQAEAKAAFDKQMAQLRAEQDVLAAELRAMKQKADEDVQAIDDETEKARLIALAKRPETQQKLAPFLEKGFWQPGQRFNNLGDESLPMSWRALVAFGVTKDGDEGIAQILAIINDRGFQPQKSGVRTARSGRHHDKERTKLSYGTNWGAISAEERQEIIELRSLLKELGPTLVELKMLSE